MFFYSSLSPLRRKIATTIAVAIVGKAINVWGAIKKRSHETIYKTYTKNEAKGLRATTLLRKVRRAITKGGAIEKSSILLSQ